MFAKTFTIGVLGASLMATAAFAETPANKMTNTTNVVSPSAMQQQGDWRASKLMGLDVYNQANEKLGDINELLIDNSGKIQGVVIGVGGFLGVGERDVAVAFDKLQFVNQPVSSNTAMNKSTDSKMANSTTTTTTTTTAPVAGTTTGSAVNTTNAKSGEHRWYPDHAVYNATKDQLKSVPEFKYQNQ
ncbi:photosystem reaction center subunit H [Rhodopseudomonas palustris]|uniref:Photosystem reaction center subunit H n=2 Tax=Nitrobacteraceae TaxID=41294 RepID=A0A0D7EEG2_RHOPL|nr:MULTISPECIES: PRC-barrel domain-containing protein [Rhodopseudomonas]KIZ38905.1 photosystem reaction center subunit H [Rhodopseudomonas palustris]MDF3813901.1 PRC-barrel domain-containing protein [Rhodopseudomonas sp. BAL398]